MLPGVAAAGGKWAVYDYQAGKTVCCLVVVGPEISEAELDSNYGIPGPWITDLVNGWNLDAAPYRPRVQLLRRRRLARLRILGHGRRAGRPAAARPGGRWRRARWNSMASVTA